AEHDTKPAVPEMLEPVPEEDSSCKPSHNLLYLLCQRLHNTMQNEAKFP
ncbi:hypothetical protein A2U01_0045079, partial [Trifolium medium]|nr:hypothetical protein [Trifolium medium]